MNCRMKDWSARTCPDMWRILGVAGSRCGEGFSSQRIKGQSHPLHFFKGAECRRCTLRTSLAVRPGQHKALRIRVVMWGSGFPILDGGLMSAGAGSVKDVLVVKI